MPRPAIAKAEGTINKSTIIGPRCSTAPEKRSSVSRAPVRSSAFMTTRQRSQANARRIRNIRLNPVERHVPGFVSYKVDEHFLKRPAPFAKVIDPPLGNELALRDDADVGGEPLDDFENVRSQEDRAAARDERLQQILDLP